MKRLAIKCRPFCYYWAALLRSSQCNSQTSSFRFVGVILPSQRLENGQWRTAPSSFFVCTMAAHNARNFMVAQAIIETRGAPGRFENGHPGLFLPICCLYINRKILNVLEAIPLNLIKTNSRELVHIVPAEQFLLHELTGRVTYVNI